MSNEKINEEFEEIIREEMTDNQFWSWVESWLDPEVVIDMAMDWDSEDKQGTIDRFNAGDYADIMPNQN